MMKWTYSRNRDEMYASTDGRSYVVMLHGTTGMYLVAQYWNNTLMQTRYVGTVEDAKAICEDMVKSVREAAARLGLFL